MRILFIIAVLSGAVAALQLPFSIPFLKSKEHHRSDTHDNTPRVAIIGAGAAGSSAAFWIALAKKRFGLQVEIDVYEKSDYIGGSESIELAIKYLFIYLFGTVQEAPSYTHITTPIYNL
jgi:prenylcysteine oxidase / farnesylcysteine lyase